MSNFVRVRVALGSLVLASSLAFQTAPLQAQVVSGTSTGWAAFADIDLLSLVPLITLTETPFLTDTAPAPYSHDASRVNFEHPDPCDSNPLTLLIPNCQLTASLLYSHVDSDVDGSAGSKTAHGQGGVEGLTLLNSFLSNVTLQSDSTVSGDFGALVPTGTTTIAAITINGSNFVNLNNIPANTNLLAFLGLGPILGINLIANEQVVIGDCITTCMIETNALHVVFNGGLIGGTLVNGDLILGHSEAKLNAVPVPAALWLFGSGLLGLLGVARRKA